MTTKAKVGAGLGAGAAAVIAAAVAFTPGWEGMDKVAKRDMIGTGHPITYCNGLTSRDGSVKVGHEFTKKECDELLAAALPKYLAKIDGCIKVDLPVKTKASLLDASFNAGPDAVCRSPMVAKMNAGDLRGGCDAFKGWYVRSDGQVRKGLIARRSGIGDGRKSERDLCLEGLKEWADIPSVVPTKPPAKTRPKWLTDVKSSPPYTCTPRQAEAGECLPASAPKPPVRKVKPKPLPKPNCDFPFPWLFTPGCWAGGVR